MTEMEVISGPLVFSCASCRVIVADSLAMVQSDEEMKTLTVSAASNITRGKELYTSCEPFDEGSTYFRFFCSSCDNLLGRYYITTFLDLDQLRQQFTFNVEAISSYELGNAQHRSLTRIPGAAARLRTSPLTENFPCSSTANQIDNCLNSVSESTDDEMHKVRHVMINLVGRVTMLESQMISVLGAISSSQTTKITPAEEAELTTPCEMSAVGMGDSSKNEQQLEATVEEPPNSQSSEVAEFVEINSKPIEAARRTESGAGKQSDDTRLARYGRSTPPQTRKRTITRASARRGKQKR